MFVFGFRLAWLWWRGCQGTDTTLVAAEGRLRVSPGLECPLRKHTTLQGELVLELKIVASGSVTGLRVLSSELQAPELEAQLLARIRSFDSGASEVAPLVVSWPLDFLPA